MSTPTAPAPSPLPSTRLRRARIVTWVAFFQLGVQLYLWGTSTVALRHQIGIGDNSGNFQFGVLTFTLGLAATIGSYAIGPIIDRFGLKKIIAATLILDPLAMVPLGYVSGFTSAVIFVFIIGVLRGFHDTSINTHGIEVQHHYGKTIMASFHASFSLGGFAIGFAGSWLASRFTESTAVAYTVFGILLAIVGAFCAPWLLSEDEKLRTTEPAEQRQARTAGVHRPLRILILVIGLGVIYLISVLSEFSVDRKSVV